ncbi:MAG: class II fructose-bisphosphate aldolase [Ruminococcaceae bacterium]|nr:class II fructose-bisphosphate aldolase [Oscillospiraceae bacterium]
MLVNLKEILDIAEKGAFAMPAFNVYNMETVMGVIEAAETLHAPVILQNYSRLFTNGESYYVAPIALAAAQKASVPVCFHLDHGAGYPEVAKAVRYGCTGVMIDASAYPLEKNIAITKTVNDLCLPMGIPVEGELGHVGSVNDAEMGEYTKVDEAKQFVDETGVAALAVMVGTAHGRYKKAPKLDIDRIREIKEAVKIPLVLHGGSGVPDEEIRASIAAGIRKVNFGTDLCYAFLDKVFETSRDIYAIDMFMKDAVANVAAFAKSKITLLGAENQA